jgi:hypothetical protein
MAKKEVKNQNLETKLNLELKFQGLHYHNFIFKTWSWIRLLRIIKKWKKISMLNLK